MASKDSGVRLQGRGSAIGFAKEATAGTAVPPTDYILNFKDSTLRKNQEVQGIPFTGHGDRTFNNKQFISRSMIEGGIKTNLYPQIIKLLAFSLGKDTVTQISGDGSANGYSHQLDIGLNPTTEYPPPLTVGQRMGQVGGFWNRQFTGLYLDSFTFGFGDQGIVELDLQFMGIDETAIDSAPNLTPMYNYNTEFLSTSVKIFLNDKEVVTETDANRLGVTDFSFTYSNNGHLEWEIGSGEGIKPTAYVVGQPTANFTFNRVNRSGKVVENLISKRSEVGLVIDIETTQKAGTGGSAENNSINITCPLAQFTDGDQQINSMESLTQNPPIEILRSVTNNLDYGMRITQITNASTSYV